MFDTPWDSNPLAPDSPRSPAALGAAARLARLPGLGGAAAPRPAGAVGRPAARGDLARFGVTLHQNGRFPFGRAFF